MTLPASLLYSLWREAHFNASLGRPLEWEALPPGTQEAWVNLAFLLRNYLRSSS